MRLWLVKWRQDCCLPWVRKISLIDFVQNKCEDSISQDCCKCIKTLVQLSLVNSEQNSFSFSWDHLFDTENHLPKKPSQTRIIWIIVLYVLWNFSCEEIYEVIVIEIFCFHRHIRSENDNEYLLQNQVRLKVRNFNTS